MRRRLECADISRPVATSMTAVSPLIIGAKQLARDGWGDQVQATERRAAEAKNFLLSHAVLENRGLVVGAGSVQSLSCICSSCSELYRRAAWKGGLRLMLHGDENCIGEGGRNA